MKKTLALALTLLPTVASAQIIQDIDGVASKALNLGNLFVTILIIFSVIWMIFGIVKYIIAGGEEERAAGKMNIVWGVVGLFLIFSIWGLVNILRNSFRTDGRVDLPRQVNEVIPQSLPQVSK